MSELVRKALGGLVGMALLGTMFFVGSQSFVPFAASGSPAATPTVSGQRIHGGGQSGHSSRRQHYDRDRREDLRPTRSGRNAGTHGGIFRRPERSLWTEGSIWTEIPGTRGPR
jgi:hypothetical protein